MRVIRFRAYDRRHGLMLAPENIVNLVDGAPRKGQTKPSSLFDCLYERFDDDQIILMQFTGLRDRHGREIYESDVVRFGDTPCTVIDRLGCWFLENTTELGYVDQQQLEILGNIYESPELVQ